MAGRIMTVPAIHPAGDTARARRSDALTSHAAGDGTATKRPHSWLLIERALADKAPQTAQELIHYIRFEIGQWISESRVTTGVKELREAGAIVPCGTRVNPSGYKGTAYRLNDEVDA